MEAIIWLDPRLFDSFVYLYVTDWKNDLELCRILSGRPYSGYMDIVRAIWTKSPYGYWPYTVHIQVATVHMDLGHINVYGSTATFFPSHPGIQHELWAERADEDPPLNSQIFIVL